MQCLFPYRRVLQVGHKTKVEKAADGLAQRIKPGDEQLAFHSNIKKHSTERKPYENDADTAQLF